MTLFESKVRDTIKANSLLRREGKVIVAVSGGADSVALLAALDALGYDCVAAHCNFHLRGEESTRDMRFVESLTDRLAIDLYVKDFDVAARCKATGESLEMACRELRYQWFRELLDRDYAQAIAVGHHREDQIETFFLNLLRGSGLAGLAGMRYRNGHVVRPLLDTSRADIEAYLNEKGLSWVVDSTNASDDFARNRLRNRLIPLLAELFPGADAAILKSMAILRENSDFYDHAASRILEKYEDTAKGEIRVADLLENERFAPALLFERLRSEGFNRSQTDNIIEASTRSGGTFRAGRSHIRDLDHGILRAPHAGSPATADEKEINPLHDIFEPIHIQVTHHEVAEFQAERNPSVAYIDERALRGSHRWTLRHWRRGDRMKPYGMKDSKLLSDIFADAHLSPADKKSLWLLLRDDEIVWAVGLRASGLFTIGPGTKRYLRLEYIP